MMQFPIKNDFVILQGADFNPVIQWRDQLNNLVDLTGCTAQMQARTTIPNAYPFIWLTTENGGITLGGTAGTIALYISAADTAAIIENYGFYDLKITFPSGAVIRLIEGNITISDEATR